MAKAVLLDSGFLIRLMNPSEPLHPVALNLFKDYVPIMLFVVFRQSL